MLMRILVAYSLLVTGGLVILARRAEVQVESAHVCSGDSGAASEVASTGIAIAAEARPVDLVGRLGVGSSAVEETTVAVPVASDRISAPLDEGVLRQREIESAARDQVRDAKRYISLTSELEERLYRFYVEQETLARSTWLPQEEMDKRYKTLGTEEAVLGRDLYRQLTDHRNERANQDIARSNEREIVYLVETLKLTGEQESELRATYDNPERYNEVNAVFLARGIQLPESQMDELRKLLSRDFFSEATAFIEAAGGDAHLPPELTTDDGKGAIVADYQKIIAQLRRAGLEQVLSEDQYNRFLEWEAKNGDF